MGFSLLASDQKSLFQELWEYITDKYFSVELGSFENFTFGSGTLISLRWVIIGISLGIIIASAMSVYDKRHLGGFIRKLINEKCFDAASAQTLESLGYLSKLGIRGSLKRGAVFARWVRCVEEDEFFSEIDKKKAEYESKADAENKSKYKAPVFKRDCKTMHFYIPEEKKYAAEVKFDSKGANWGSFFIVLIAALILCIFICYILPDMLHLVDNFISVMKGN